MKHVYCSKECQTKGMAPNTCCIGVRVEPPVRKKARTEPTRSDTGIFGQYVWQIILDNLSLDDLQDIRRVNSVLASLGLQSMLRRFTFVLNSLQDLNSSELVPFIGQIKRIRFTDNFNEPITDEMLPLGLTHLEFGEHFNQPVDNLPQSLTHLTFGRRFNQPVDNLPQSLTHLTFGTRFDRPVDNLPQSLTHLTFGDGFDQPVDNLPQSLTHLTFRRYYRPINNLPQGLVYLRLSRTYRWDLPALPPTLGTWSRFRLMSM